MRKAQTTSAGARPIKKEDIYTRVTNKIIEDLEKGVRPWTKPWSAEHAAGSITKPLRHNGEPTVSMSLCFGRRPSHKATAPRTG